MIFNPRPGQRVQVWYAAKHRDTMPFHGKLATVAKTTRGRPRNHLIRTDAGHFVVVPAGNLREPK